MVFPELVREFILAESFELLMYTKQECGLCDEMKKVIEKVSAKTPVALTTVDIETDPELKQQYGLEIPLLFHRGECLAKYRVNEKVLLKKIEKLRQGTPL